MREVIPVAVGVFSGAAVRRVKAGILRKADLGCLESEASLKSFGRRCNAKPSWAAEPPYVGIFSAA